MTASLKDWVSASSTRPPPPLLLLLLLLLRALDWLISVSIDGLLHNAADDEATITETAKLLQLDLLPVSQYRTFCYLQNLYFDLDSLWHTTMK